MKSKKHIYFEDSDDCEREVEKEKTDIIIIDDNNSRQCILMKKSESETFGFQVNGKTNLKGSHTISSVSNRSCADLAGLKVNDKIISVNGVLVGDSSIDELINLIENETKKNQMRLELVVSSASDVELIELQDSDEDNDLASKTRKRCNLSTSLYFKYKF